MSRQIAPDTSESPKWRKQRPAAMLRIFVAVRRLLPAFFATGHGRKESRICR